MNLINGLKMIIIEYLMYNQVNGQCDFDSLSSYCSIPVKAFSIFSSSLTTADYIIMCSSYNEFCFTEIGKCYNRSDTFATIYKDYSHFKFLCSDLGKEDIKLFQNCLSNKTYINDLQNCQKYKDASIPYCLYSFNYISCAINSSHICNGEYFTCRLLTYANDLVTACNASFNDCFKKGISEDFSIRYNNRTEIVLSSIIIGSLAFVIIATIVVICWANRKIKAVKK